MGYNEIIDQFQASFPKGFICRDNIPDSVAEWNDEGLYQSNLRADALKRALQCRTSCIDDEMLVNLLPVIEYTDLLFHYYNTRVVPMEKWNGKKKSKLLNTHINNASDLIDLAKNMGDEQSAKALQSFVAKITKYEKLKQLTKNRIYDNFLFLASYLSVELTDKIRPTKKILNVVNELLERYFQYDHKYKEGIEINNFLKMEFQYQTAVELHVRYSANKAG
ncbi:hypothetical protein [Sulfuricurvum sp.]|uniref:hypothetical protein n=1 Tax=Sulfuricurvum sp. TaxID=2025608 RepID=UPI00262953A3|nr:hypothetical protein [Sulfuricurvum sp.]MDD2265703.1 hypothetical protein [Sulfuricurvum sp.]MDD2784008.1 hypothetical protein [Sulfuricurvum sp.]